MRGKPLARNDLHVSARRRLLTFAFASSPGVGIF
jgi:hypothetical protein